MTIQTSQRDLKPSTPIADHIPNMSKVREIRRHPPMDADVVKFLTAAFLVIYKFMKWVWQSYEMGLIKDALQVYPFLLS